MFVYHATLFARGYGLGTSTIPYGLGWVIFQRFIAGSFFFLVGVSLFLGYVKSINVGKYFFRWGQIVGCAMIVTLTSIVLWPDRMVTFGILHSISVCSLLALVFLRLKLTRLTLPVGVLIIVVGAYYENPLFNHPLLQWTGLSTCVTPALDYQPVLPWFGVSLLGIALAPYIETLCKRAPLPRNPATNSLAFLGQHTLFLYMAHVPAILGTLELLKH
jgi:uncharacterized membrane protein